MTKKELNGKRKLPVPGHADWTRARGDFPRNHKKKRTLLFRPFIERG